MKRLSDWWEHPDYGIWGLLGDVAGIVVGLVILFSIAFALFPVLAFWIGK